MSKNNSSKRPIASYFTNNLLLKVAAAVFAIILWSFVTIQTNPERTKTLRDIPVALQGLETLESNGFTLRDKFSENPPVITVKVSAKYSEFMYIDESVVFASIDVSKITTDGAAGVNVGVTFSNVAEATLISVEPRTINVTVDKIATKEVPLERNELNALPEGLTSLHTQMPENVSISGSSYYVERISKALVDVDLSLLTDGQIINQACRFVDENNNPIKFEGSSVTVDMDVQTLKELPVNTNGCIKNSGKVAEGYEFTGVSVGKVTVCGHTDDIANLTELNIRPIDILGRSESFQQQAQLMLPAGISLVSEAPQAKITISEKKETATFECPISVSNLASGHTAVITSSGKTVNISADGNIDIKASVSVTAPKSVLSSVKATDIIVRLSLLGKEAGIYELTPVVTLNSSLASGVSAQIVSPTQLHVTVS